MTWIKMRVELATDPAVMRLSKLTGIDRFGVVGRLHALWSWFDVNSTSGRVAFVDADDLSNVVGERLFVDALCEISWLKIKKDCSEIPHFHRHNGASTKERLLKNQRQARWRDGNLVDGPPSTSPSTEASTREEKRREEKRREENTKTTPPVEHPPRKRGSALTDAWEIPEEWLQWALEQRQEWTHQYATRVSLEFRDYWIGNGQPMANWKAVWRNWVRRQRVNGRAQTPAQRRDDNWRKITGQDQTNARVIELASARVDSQDHVAIACDIRKQSEADVG